MVMIESAEEISRRHRAEAEMIDRDARHQREFGVDDRGLAGAQGEIKGPRQARQIEQGVNDQRARSGARTLNPRARNSGNSSPCSSVVRIDRPRASRP